MWGFVEDAVDSVKDIVKDAESVASGLLGGGGGGVSNSVNTQIDNAPIVTVNPNITVENGSLAAATRYAAEENAKALRIVSNGEKEAAIKAALIQSDAVAKAADNESQTALLAANIEAQSMEQTAAENRNTLMSIARGSGFLFAALGLLYILKKGKD
jgi:regulator of protease activity HflC (stomatin/prohibitin superfamily)